MASTETNPTWVIDLDGVVWRGPTPIEGSVDALSRLADAGHRVVFCTNFAESPLTKQSRLAEMGVPEPVVVTSAEAAAHLCGAGQRALVLGEPGLVEVLLTAGIEAIDVRNLDPEALVPEVEAVVVGATADWDRRRTGLAADAVRAGARFIATNDDPTFPWSGPSGPRLLPGAGALVAAVEVSSGVRAVVAGKPNEPIAELIRERYGTVDYVVGDRHDTDGLLARRLDARFALVLSGSTAWDGVPTDPAPHLVEADLASVVDRVLAGTDGSSLTRHR